MLRHHLTTTVGTALLIALGALPPAVAQQSHRNSGRPAQTASPPSTPSSTNSGAPDPAAAEWWAAQRSLETTIQQLEEYLRRAPTGEHAATARRQLEALRALRVTAQSPAWALMGSLPLRHIPHWRVAAAIPETERTRLRIEIACRREDGGDCSFYPFDSFPLVLVDSSGRAHPMLEIEALPADIRLREDGQAALSAGQTVTVTIDFAPLAEGATSGQVYYRERNRAEPARFSLLRRR